MGVSGFCNCVKLKSSPLRKQGGWGIIFGVFGELGDMCMLDEIRARRDEIYAIARRHKAEKLWVFGSCVHRDSISR